VGVKERRKDSGAVTMGTALGGQNSTDSIENRRGEGSKFEGQATSGLELGGPANY